MLIKFGDNDPPDIDWQKPFSYSPESGHRGFVSSSASIDQLIEKAFKLAFFIHAEKQVAIDITIEAMDKLELASVAQDKRLYYRPVGRSLSRAARTRVSLDRKHLIQRLIYIESEPYERLKESHPHGLTQNDLLVHFIKHLVRLVIKRNSFYVALGLSRLLYNYTTAETMDMYNFIVQDPDRIREDTYYRMRKMQLIREMKDRFGSLIKTCKNARREERFQSQPGSNELLQLVRNCLVRFTPWDTHCILLEERLDRDSHAVAGLLFKGVDPDDEHVIEINRIHSLLHPICYRRLTVMLALDLPDSRIEIPLFFIPNQSGPTRRERTDPPDLEERDYDHIKRVLNDRSKRRGKLSRELLSIAVDGQERAQWNPLRDRRIELEIEDGSDIIEVRDKQERLPLAIYLLEYDESGIRPVRQTVKLQGDQTISFDISVTGDSGAQDLKIRVAIECEPVSQVQSSPLSLRRLASGLKERGWRISDLIVSPMTIALLIGVTIFGIYLRLQTQSPVTGPEQPAATENSNSENRQPSNPTQSTNQSSNSRAPAPTVRKPDTPETPPGNRGVTDSKHPRSLGADEKATSLKLVRRIYIDSLGANEAGIQLRNELLTLLTAVDRFVVTKDREQADAVLGGVAKSGANDRRRVALTVQLIDEQGQIIWPLNKRKSYNGGTVDVAKSVVRDLLKDIQRLERKQ